MRHLLRDVAVYGSAKRANVPGYQVIGKTGTANKLVNGHYKDKVVMTSFLSAFPMNNPQYALLVVMDAPKATKETWGFVTSGWNAVPTGGRIIEAIAPQLNIQADFDIEKQRQNVKAAYIR
jgi:cell division protein FtsI (penicillin-binding protein 3)